MKTKILPLLISVASLAFAGAANAQFLNGSLTLSALVPGTGSATASTLDLSLTNVVASTTGSFASLVPLNSILYAPHPGTTGLSSSPLADPISDFFVFADQYPAAGGAKGTTPPDRFDFNLATLTENFYDSANGTALFTGTGMIVDTTGDNQDTAGEFTVNFSGPGNYTLTILTVPEPATITLAAAGLLGLLALRRRRA